METSTAQEPGVSKVTRYLCASVFTGGWAYRHKLRKFFRDHIHAVAPSPGVDTELLRSVLQWNFRRSLLFHLLITVLGIAAVLVSPLSNPLAMVFATLGIAPLPEGAEQTIVYGLVMQVLLGCLWYRHVYQGLWSIPIAMFGPKTCSAAAIRRKCPPQQGQSEATSVANDGAAGSAQESNVVVFQGFSPFVGFGFEVSDWSLVVDTSKPPAERPDHEASPVTLKEVYQRMSKAIGDLRLPGLAINDWLFVDGREVKGREWLLPHLFARPLSNADASTIDNYLLNQHSDTSVRAYRSIRTVGWDSELEVQSLFRFTLLGPMLSIEGKQLLLTPVDERYRTVDNLVPPSWPRRILMFLLCIQFAGILMTASGLMVLAALFRPLADLLHRFECRRQIRIQPDFNYGAREGLRAAFSSPNYLRYYQKIDKQTYVRAIEKRFLDALIEYLESKGIDTSDLDSQKTLLINSGVLIQGGITAEAVAVGEKSRATKTTGVKRVLGKMATAAGGKQS